MRATAVIGKAADTAEVVVRQLGDIGGGQGRAVARRTLRRGRRAVAYTRGRLAGLRYAAAGRHPDEHVTDDVLADRVRTSLGPVLHRLDLPKVHVTVERHVVTLHGDASSLADVKKISRAVAAVPGVAGVRSALHVGLLPGNYRPSWGRRTAPPSPASTRASSSSSTPLGERPDERHGRSSGELPGAGGRRRPAGQVRSASRVTKR